MRTTSARRYLALLVTIAACGADEPDEVRLDLHWNLSRAGQMLACTDVDAVSVDWLLDGDDGRDFTFTFDCVDNLSSYVLVPEQIYTVSAKLRRADDVVLAQCIASYDPTALVGAPPCNFEVP